MSSSQAAHRDLAETLCTQHGFDRGAGPGETVGRERLDAAVPDLAFAQMAPELLTLGAELPQGGRFKLLQAHQHALARDLLVKTPREGDTTASPLLVREARIAARLEHPGVAPVYALAGNSQHPMLLLKALQGQTWAQALRATAPNGACGDPYALDAALNVLASVCQTVAYAHSQGVIHRDLKPAHVTVGAWGEVVVTDWGVALPLDEASALDASPVGTPAYMAPEVVAGEPITPATDVFGLGALLHEVLTGAPRYAGDDLVAVVAQAAAAEPFAYGPHVPAPLAELCRQACARDPARRPASALAFREALRTFQSGRSVDAALAAAEAQLAALRELVRPQHAPAPPPESALRRLGPCRFAFRAVLDLDPEHARAAAGHDDALEAVAEAQLRANALDAAAALLGELLQPRPALQAAVDAARAARDEAEAALRRAHAATRMAGDDWLRSVSALAVGAVALISGLWLGAAWRHGAPINSLHDATPLLLGAMASLLWVWRFRHTTFNSPRYLRYSLAQIAIIGLSGAGCLIAHFAGIPQYASGAMLAGAGLAFAVTLLLCVDGTFWRSAAIALGALVLSAYHREYYHEIVGGCLWLDSLHVAWYLRPGAQENPSLSILALWSGRR